MNKTLTNFLIDSQFLGPSGRLNSFSIENLLGQRFLNGQSYAGLEYIFSLDGDNWWITILKFVIIPFIFLISTTLVILLIRNQYMSIKLEKRKKSIEDDVNTLLTELIFLKENGEHIANKIEAFKLQIPFHKKWCQNYMLHKILEINQTFHVDQRLHRDIFMRFGFDRISNRLLRHKKWYLNSLGIYRMQRMHVESKSKQIAAFLKDTNPEIKSNALIAMVTLSPEKFAALRDHKEPLTKADEMKILDLIYESQPNMPANSKKLLKSTNISIVVLGIKLMVQYKEKFSLIQMSKLIRFPNVQVRKEATKAVGKLKMLEANDILISQYHLEQDKKVKINILRSLKSIGNQKSAFYLESMLATESNSDIKFEMVNCINKLDPAFFDNSYSMTIAKDHTIKDMALHVKDPYLV